MCSQARQLYQAQGIDTSRVLVKIASTWEGIQAARVLEREHGVNCNITLIFSRVQAIAAAEAGASIVSPFVARIQEWYSQHNSSPFTKGTHPSIVMINGILNYFKKFSYNTLIMGASFKHVEEVSELASIDALTIPVSDFLPT